jgi:hypothetical protein
MSYWRMFWIFSLLGLGACSGQPGPPREAGSGDRTGDLPLPSTDVPIGATDRQSEQPYHECPKVTSRCTGFASREACVDTPEGRRLKQETCAQGAGCVAGACVSGKCADECTLFEPKCVLYSLAQNGEVTPDPKSSTADRARLYNAWLVRDMLPAGGVVSMYYSDATLSKRAWPDVVGDSAEWTGTYLLGEALRAQATSSPDGKESIARLVKTLDLWLHVSGAPGYLARYVESVDNPPPVISSLKCGVNVQHHCNTVYQGQHYNWHGWTSRDMYQGVMTGLATAYDATDDEAVRDTIRRDIVEVVEELMRDRVVPFDLYVDSVKFPIDIQSRFIILNPSEMDSGRVSVHVSTGNLVDSAEMRGLVEFVPDFAGLLRQLPLLAWLPNIPRYGSMIMLASFFLSALRVTENVPAYAQRRQAIAAFYQQHADEWLNIPASAHAMQPCGQEYYGATITFTAAYNLARLEQDPVRGPHVRNDLLLKGKWPPVSTHKNAYFALITAAYLSPPDPSIAKIGTTQVSLFPPAPRIAVPVNLTATIASDPTCTSTNGSPTAPESQALDLDKRPPEDFQWQRHPWALVSTGDLQHVFSGVDYLVAYWMARYHGFMPDDRPGVCTRRQ